jgi:hypothetical protein
MTDGEDITPREERIRRRAYELWEQAGRPGDDHQKFWLIAEIEIAAEEDDPGAGDRTIPRREKP